MSVLNGFYSITFLDDQLLSNRISLIRGSGPCRIYKNLHRNNAHLSIYPSLSISYSLHCLHKTLLLYIQLPQTSLSDNSLVNNNCSFIKIYCYLSPNIHCPTKMIFHSNHFSTVIRESFLKYGCRCIIGRGNLPFSSGHWWGNLHSFLRVEHLSVGSYPGMLQDFSEGETVRGFVLQKLE